MKSPYSSSALGSELLSVKPAVAAMGVVCVFLLIALGTPPRVGLSTLLLGAGCAGFLLIGKPDRDLLHPVRVFGALWCFCLALASMRLLPFISEWGPRMWVCTLTPLASFPVGVWAAERFFRGDRGMFSTVRGGEPEGNRILERRALVTAAACLIIGMSVLVYEYHLIGEIPILSENPDVARMELFGVAGQQDPQFDTIWIKLIHPFVEFNKYAFFLALLVLIQGTKSRRVAFFCAVIMLLGVLAFGSQGARSFLVEIAIVSIALVHYLRRQIRLREFSIAGMLLFLFIALYGSFRTQKSESAPLFERAFNVSNLPPGAFWEEIAFGYATVTISFEVFNRLIDDLQYVQRPTGGFIFYSLHRFVRRSNIQEFAFNLYGGETITSTFLGEFYGDYGYGGVLLGPLLFGVGYGWAYLQGFRNGSRYWMYVRALLLQRLLFFPYVNLFSQYLTWIFDLFFMYWLLRWSSLGGEEALRRGG